MAGVGGFGIYAAKRNPNCFVLSNDLNPAAVKCMKINMKYNKVGRDAPLTGYRSILFSLVRAIERFRFLLHDSYLFIRLRHKWSHTISTEGTSFATV